MMQFTCHRKAYRSVTWETWLCRSLRHCSKAVSARQEYEISAKCTESRADHGLEIFWDSLYPYGKYGRHEETRTPDLYRVKSLVIGNSITYRLSRDCKITHNPS